MAQQILKEVDGMFKSFLGLIKLAKKGKYQFKDIKLPSFSVSESSSLRLFFFTKCISCSCMSCIAFF